MTLLQAVTVREKELSSDRLRDKGVPDMTVFGGRAREIILLMLRV